MTIRLSVTTCLASSLFWMAPAGAQTALAVPEAAESAAPEEGIADIIVTAQRREESTQRSSLSIAVVGAADMAKSNLTQAEGLSRLVPNLQIGSQTYSRIYLRGVGDNTANGFAQSAVAFNVDGVHVARTTQYSGNFYDVSRIEVLKGPQGTLYGRNASAGVINVITNAPSTKGIAGSASINFGNYDLVQVQGALNVPLTDTLAARAAFNFVDRDGYLEDGYNDEKQRSGRMRIQWQPIPQLTLNFKADHTYGGGMGQSGVVYPTPKGVDPWMAASGPLVRSYQIAANAPPVPDDGYVRNKYSSVSFESIADLGFAEFTTISALRWQDFAFYASPAGNLNLAETDKVNQATVEARLARNVDSFKWVAGLYYFDEITRQTSRIDQGARAGATTGLSSIFTRYRAPTQATALFADGNLALTDSLRLLGGIRYTNETRGLFGTTTTFSTIASVPSCAGTGIAIPDPSFRFCLRGNADNSVKNDAVTWRAGVEFDLAPRSMVYFTANKGFKSGGVYSGAAPGNDYEPEFLTAYDGGIRNRFFDNTLQLNLSGFYWDYTNYQFSFVNFDVRGVSALVTRNAGAARVYGGSADMVWQPTHHDTLKFNVEYLNARFTHFTYTTPQASDPSRMCAAQGVVGSVKLPSGANASLFGFDCSGLALPRAPKWSIQGGYSRSFDLANGGQILADVDAQYSSSYKLDVTTVEFMTQHPYALLNAQLAYTAPDNRWGIAIWGRNLTNHAVYTDARRYGATNFAGADIRPPRTYGVRANVNF